MLTSLKGSSERGTITIRGWMQYHPLVEGAETRPRPIGGAGIGITGDGISLSVYWEGRLVPDTVVHELPFFADLETVAKCNRERVATQWKQRVHGQLFLDSSFDAISNNKLQITVSPSFEQWLNTADKLPLFQHVKAPFKR